MRLLYYLILFICSLQIFLTSCVKQLAIELPFDGKELVLNSLFQTDSLLYARVTFTTEQKYINNFPEPDGATIKLFQNGIFKEDMRTKIIYQKKYFVSSSVAEPGNEYTLKAFAPGYDTVTGTDIAPQKAEFFIQEISKTNTSSNSNYNTKLTLRLKDNPGQKNYYSLRLFGADTNVNATGPRFTIDPYSYYFEMDQMENNSLIDFFGGTSSNKYAIFSDDTFNGKEITLTCRFNFYQNKTHLAVELTQLSKETYQYLLSTNNQWENEGNPFVEPVIVYNNIKGGYGIVGGYNKGYAFAKKP